MNYPCKTTVNNFIRMLSERTSLSAKLFSFKENYTKISKTGLKENHYDK